MKEMPSNELTDTWIRDTPNGQGAGISNDFVTCSPHIAARFRDSDRNNITDLQSKRLHFAERETGKMPRGIDLLDSQILQFPRHPKTLSQHFLLW